MNKRRIAKQNLSSYFGLDEFVFRDSCVFASESLCVLLFFPAINFYLNQILQTYFSFSSFSALFYVLMAVLGFLSYFKLLPKVPASVVIISFFIVVSSLVSYLLYPEISEVFFNKDFNPLTSAFLGIGFYCIPAMLCASSLKDKTYFLKRVRLYALVTVIVGMISFYFFTIVSLSEDIPNYMVYSYNMLAGLGPLIIVIFHDKNPFLAIVAILGAICMLMVGARGAQVSMLLTLLTSIIVFTKNRSKTVSIIIFLLLLFLLLLMHVSDIVDFIDNALGEYNIHSRTLNKLVDGNFFTQSGRDKLRDIVSQGIYNRPFLGYGLFGDRYLTATMGWGEPAYCHNIYLELCCDLGIVLGSMSFIALLVLIAHNLISKRKMGKTIAVLICMPCGFFELFFSGSYIISTAFFALLGFLLNNKVDNEKVMIASLNN